MAAAVQIKDAVQIGQGVSIATTETPIKHGKPGIPKAVLLGCPVGNAVVYQTRAADVTYVYLAASTACTVDVFVVFSEVE